ncbi:MAG: hypothetical protein LAT58_01365 [Opitutales bacterium]|nr:hypothetical protein [Opitutales bacterium]
MARFCLYPPVPDQSRANDLLARLTWFFADIELEEIRVFAEPGACSFDLFECPDYLDTSIPDLYEKIRPAITIRPFSMDSLGRPWDAVFLWQDLGEHHSFLREQLGKTRVWKVDPERTRMEGSFWMEAHLALPADKEATVSRTREQLNRCGDEFAGMDRAVIIGSGPSAKTYADFNYSGALTLVCNSVVADTELLDQIQPRVICFADPIFHFGPSRYAMDFRQRMREAFARHRPWIVVPLKYHRFLVERIPEIADRLIGLPHAHRMNFNINLRQGPQVKTTANILSYLLLPFAATFARAQRFVLKFWDKTLAHFASGLGRKQK